MSLSLPIWSDVQSLRQLAHDDFQPFRLLVAGQEILAQRCLRLVRGRRLVVQGVWNDHNIIAKILYHPRKSKLHYTQECWGHDQLRQLGFDVAELLHAGQLDGMPQVYIVIYKELYPFKAVSQLLATFTPEEAWERLQQCQSLIVQMYSNGLYQKDAHWDNFVLVHDTIYPLDYMTIRPLGSPNKEINNLATFYTRLPLAYQLYCETLFQDYCDKRGVQHRESVYKRVQKEIDIRRWHRAKRLLNTCVRASKGFKTIQCDSLKAVYDQAQATPAIQRLLRDPDGVLQQIDRQVLKSDRTTTVVQVNLDGQALVVKRYNVKGVLHFLTHCWRRSRAMKSWRNGWLLNYFKVPTAKPVAVIEKRFWGLKAQNFIVMEALSGQTLDQYLAKAEFPESIFRYTAFILSQLAILRIRHRDLKASNFLVGDNQVYLIDVDAMRVYRYTKHWLRVFNSEIDRFRRNWCEQPQQLQIVDKILATMKLYRN